MTVAATASDDLGVTGVQFSLDGAPLGAEIGSAPYEISWNTGTMSNGAHALTVVARMPPATPRPRPVSVTVANDSAEPTVLDHQSGRGAVAGNVTVAAAAADDVGVVGVQFRDRWRAARRGGYVGAVRVSLAARPWPMARTSSPRWRAMPPGIAQPRPSA